MERESVKRAKLLEPCSYPLTLTLSFSLCVRVRGWARARGAMKETRGKGRLQENRATTPRSLSLSLSAPNRRGQGGSKKRNSTHTQGTHTTRTVREGKRRTRREDETEGPSSLSFPSQAARKKGKHSLVEPPVPPQRRRDAEETRRAGRRVALSTP